MKIKQAGLLIIFLGLISLIGPINQAHSKPKISVPQEELESETKDEHGLDRVFDLGKFHVFGYGELHYNGNVGAPEDNEIDFHRLVLGFGYDFNDWLEFRAELDFEHAFTEPELEFAYLDFLIKEWVNIRVGSILVPMGVLNQHHEPPLFNGVERPNIYRVIMPTSWQEGGAGFHGKFGNGFDYELYAMTTPSAVETDGTTIDSSFNGSNGIRGGRGHVAEAPGTNIGFSGRLQYTGTPGLRIGTSVFGGFVGQGTDAIDSAFLTMVEADAKYSFAGIDLEGIVAFSSLSNADDVNNFILSVDPTFSNFVGSQMLGWYVEGAYHLFHHVLPDTKHDLIAFGRFEKFNTQQSMPTGFAANTANDRSAVVVGLTYKPIPQVAIKVDYNFNWNEANAGVDTYNLGVGFYY